jgi:hypothetical protein
MRRFLPPPRAGFREPVSRGIPRQKSLIAEGLVFTPKAGNKPVKDGS